VIGAGLGAAAVIASFALTGHAATTDPRWLVVGADLAHTLAGAAWFGGLVLLLVALRRRRAVDDPVGGGRLVARFSTLATGAVLLVAVAGSGLAWAQVRTLRALTGNVYGWTLLAKVALVVAVLAVGLYNNRRLVPAIARGTNKAWRILRRTVRYEVVGLVAVVALTGVLTNLRPAAVAEGVTGAFSTEAQLGEDYRVNLTVDPNRAGDNEVHLYLLGADGRPADVARELTLRLSLPAQDIGPIEREPVVAGPGHWQLNGSELSIPGEWVVGVTARVSDFEQLSAEIPVPVNP
jgi:copper transport protein